MVSKELTILKACVNTGKIVIERVPNKWSGVR